MITINIDRPALRISRKEDEEAAQPSEPLANYTYDGGLMRDDPMGDILPGETLEEALDRNGFEPQARERFIGRRSGVRYAFHPKRDGRARQWVIVVRMPGDPSDRLPEIAFIQSVWEYTGFLNIEELQRGEA